MNDLPRLKPDPIPAIRPVPEYQADERLQAVYAETKERLQTPWMGVVTMAFAAYPNFYGALWSGFRVLADQKEFVDACARLRSEAETAAVALGPTPLQETMLAKGYGPREIDEIRALIEVFSHGNMPYLMIATAARMLLEGDTLSETRAVTPYGGRHGPAAGQRLTLIEPHHADAPTQDLYAEIQSALGLPFVNTDYRALARWPSYFQAAWGDLRPKIGTTAYEAAATKVHARATTEMRAAPNPGDLSAERLIEAAGKDATVAEVREVVRLFQWLLPGLALNVAYFRSQLGGSPTL
ncbi:MAG: halocarboxylic acid dehydrogenase DehI family protein [Pseudomonadota bacterium]